MTATETSEGESLKEPEKKDSEVVDMKSVLDEVVGNLKTDKPSRQDDKGETKESVEILKKDSSKVEKRVSDGKVEKGVSGSVTVEKQKSDDKVQKEESDVKMEKPESDSKVEEVEVSKPVSDGVTVASKVIVSEEPVEVSKLLESARKESSVDSEVI